jgi:gamma-glutamyltranspeptidase/glutathione hydrolase
MRSTAARSARAIVAKSQALGGPMTMEDLANYKGEWVDAASTTYHDRSP